MLFTHHRAAVRYSTMRAVLCLLAPRPARLGTATLRPRRLRPHGHPRRAAPRAGGLRSPHAPASPSPRAKRTRETVSPCARPGDGVALGGGRAVHVVAPAATTTEHHHDRARGTSSRLTGARLRRSRWRWSPPPRSCAPADLRRRAEGGGVPTADNGGRRPRTHHHTVANNATRVIAVARVSGLAGSQAGSPITTCSYSPNAPERSESMPTPSR